MKGITFSVFLIIGLMLSCCSTSKEGIQASGQVIVQESVAYDLDPKNFYTELPDTLGSENLHGKASIEVYIDEQGQFVGYNLIKLILKDKNGVIKVSFTDTELPQFNSNLNAPGDLAKSTDSYPKMIKKYHEFINDYLEGLKYKRVKQVDAEAISAYSFLLRFK